MCDVVDHHALDPLEEDEWVLDTSVVRGFVDSVRAAVERTGSAAEACRLLGPTDTRRVTPLHRSRRKMSATPFVSPATKSEAEETNAT